MNAISTAITYGETGFFSGMILDYLCAKDELKPFYTYPVSTAGIQAAIESRKAYDTNRNLLVDTLHRQYSKEPATSRQLDNIQLLNNNNCFTVTTAHQPNIFTGHLYFIYKILHAIKLCEKLKTEMPENDFVPVFYMGSEDADLDELGHIYVNGARHEWGTNQTGAVGRMRTDKALIKILLDIEGELAVQPYGKEIVELMKTCYTAGSTIEQATCKMVNALFGEYGLIVLLPDDAAYKKAFIPVVKKELLEQFSYPIVKATAVKFPKQYKVQAAGRELNMFYLKDDRRERIEKVNGQWSIVNSELIFTEQEIMQELKNNPERFSPNVILRPVFQEMILPNIAFIGGGGEIAYWLELKDVFAAVQVPFPVLVLRNSFLLIENSYRLQVNSLGFDVADIFKTETELLNILVKRDSNVRLSLQKEKQEIEDFYKRLQQTAGAVDTTLQPHTESLKKLALKKIEALEKKMLRAQKKKFDAQQRQLHKLKSQLFPHNNLQERVENFMPFYAKWGKDFIKAICEKSLALEQEFVIVQEQ